MDLTKKSFSLEIGGETLTLSTSILAGQTNATVLGSYGDTVVLATVVMSHKNVDLPYFPLKVDYEEKFYAVGKILGSRFMRREGRPSKDATLNARLIDRTLRPLFDHNLRRNIQVVVTILSHDGENQPDFVSLVSASTALAISDIPANGPVAGVRVGYIDGKEVVNPKKSELENADLDLFVCGSKDRLSMLEAGAKEVSNDMIVAATKKAQEEIVRIVELQEQMIKEVGLPKAEIEIQEPPEGLEEVIDKFVGGKLEEAVFAGDKTATREKLSALSSSLEEHLKEKGFEDSAFSFVSKILDQLTDKVVHLQAIENNRRQDGRSPDEIRQLQAGVSVLKRAHGTGLFMRGDTQVLSVTTLAAPGQEQLIETIEYSGTVRFLHHYNFPPYSVGETGFFRGPGRRDIGHGALAEKALLPVIPSKEDFPYTIRVVSETLSSNGSSSMASACAASMSLMDAGVPIKTPVAGIAMGLMSKEDKYVILTDIQGPEDHHGDMDLKVAGTKDGVTAMQMDVKIDGITLQMFTETMEKAQKARLTILETTNKAIPKGRDDLSVYAPRVYTLHINPEKIGDVIGPGGKMINSIIEKTGTLIDIEQDGSVFVTGENSEKVDMAVEIIKNLTRDYEVGEVVEGKVVRIMEFGAIIEFAPKRDGMVHISEIAPKRIDRVEDYLKVGDQVKARIVKVDKAAGRIGLSTKEFVE